MGNSHFVGLNYQRASFRAFIDNDGFYFEDEYSNDVFHRWEVVGRFRLSDRWQVRVGLPVVYQTMEGSQQNLTVSGLADPTVTVHVMPINTGNDFTRDVMHVLMLGTGVKAPLGQFNLQDQGARVNPNFQPGTGSWDFLFNASYTLRWANVGLNVDGTAKYNRMNPDGYQIGHQMNTMSTLFYFVELPWGSFLPQAGIQWEAGQPHRQEGVVMGNTGGTNLLGTAGVQFFRKKMGVNVQAQLPFSQRFNTDANVSIEGGTRVSVGLLYSLGG
ncbi:MAG TPA: hypothetical protein DCR93_06875 [Cytophagales bacterium]|nr:hypothetical protein [Cytophagales bacterium]HAP59225.1 hypothetical protein [Cytophagales bacterium]